MSFAKAKREFYVDEETRKRANLPGPSSYRVDASWNTKGFKYHDLTCSTIHESSAINRTVMDRSCDDIDLHFRNNQSTPLKRGQLSASVRGKPRAGSARKGLNMNVTKEQHAAAMKYQEQLEKREQKYLALFQDHEALKNTVESLKGMLKDLEEERKDFQKVIKKKEEEIHAAKEESTKLEEQNKDQSWRIETLENECKELKLKDEQTYKQKVELEERQLAYMKEIENYEKKCADIETNFENEQKRLIEKSKQLEHAEIEVYNKRQEIEQLKFQLDEAKSNHAADLDVQVRDANQLRNRIAQLESEKDSNIATLEKEIKQLQGEIESMTFSSGQQTNTLNKYKDVIAELESTLSQKEKQISSILAKHQEEVERLQLEKDENNRTHESAIEQLKNEVESKTNEIEEARETNTKNAEDTEARIGKLENEILELKASLQTSKVNEQELASRNKDLETELDCLNSKALKQSTDLSSKNKDLESEIEVLTAKTLKQSTDFETEMCSLTSEMENLTTKNLSMKKKLEEYTNAGKYFKEKCAKLKSELSEKDREISALKQQEVDTTELTKAQASLESERKVCESLRLKVKTLLEEQSNLRKEAVRKQNDDDFKSQLRHELESLEVQLANVKLSEENWRTRFEELERFVTPYRQDLAKYAAEAAHMGGENSKKAKELQELHCKLADSMGHQNQKQKIRYMAKIKQELQETKEKLSGKECELKKAKRQIEVLTDDVNALKGIRRFDPKKAFAN